MSFGLLFHHFHNEKHIKTQGSITEKDFRNLLNFVQKEYNLLSAEMWLDLQSKNRLGKQDVCITFDDALKSQYVVAYPVLQEYSIKAFWFLHTSFLEDRYDKLEIFRDFRHRSFDDIEDFYIDFFKYLETKDLYSLKYSQIINEIDFKSYLKNFELYSYNDRKFRYIRDYMLSFKEYELIMFQMM
ncbi:MAG: polysaccharide deacetylase family protein, partial [Campylobacterales bacterium]|nr:polysaccharide deacetylase family protein [Campylobacterales bacterium]